MCCRTYLIPRTLIRYLSLMWPLNGGSGTITVNTSEAMLLTLWNGIFYFLTHLFVAVHAKSISSSPSAISVESSESVLSFFAFLDLGSLSSALFVLTGRFPFPLVPCKIIFRINQNPDLDKKNTGLWFREKWIPKKRASLGMCAKEIRLCSESI